MEKPDLQIKNQTTVIKANPSWSFVNVRELLAYRELIWVMIVRDIKVRYKQTVMGVAWAVIQPLTMMVIFTLIFGKLAKIPSDGFPYPIFVFSGMLAWSFFSSSISSAGMSLVGSGNLISKVYFPRIIIPLASIGVSLVDFLIGSLILLCLMLYYNLPISISLIFLPVYLSGLILVSIGIGSWLAAVTVTYRDFRFVIPFMIQIWMYLTPIIYPLSFVPQKWQWLLHLNPMYAWISGVRASFLGEPVDQSGMLISLAFSILIFLVGLTYFEKAQRRFADVI